VDLNFDKDLPFISADRIQLQQVMLNLLQNAIDAMRDIKPTERKIRIETKSLNKETVAITVNDTGPGFSKEVVHKVFKPFFSTKANGRGMGLAICRSIIEAHGGVFTINSNTSNHSWIRFTLPTDNS
jgi:two-component system sensor kinase FixL